MLRVVLVILFYTLPQFSYAIDENPISLIIHGASIHSGCKEGNGRNYKKCEFNEFNPGMGVDLNVIGNYEAGFLSLRGGIYDDSYHDLAYYAGAMYRKEWLVSDDVGIGIGVQAGYLNGSEHHGFAMVPVVMLSYKKTVLEIGYVSKSWGDDRRSNVTMFTIRWAL